MADIPLSQRVGQLDESLDAGSRSRVSLLTTLADLKTLDADETLLLENVGTGTGTWANNKYNMSVTSGQYRIRKSKRYYHYFSGKSQQVECTFDNFQVEANTVKRVGYFSSNATAPYDSNKDGFWLENDGTTVRLIVSRNGTETLNVAQSAWNTSVLSGYDWSKFTVVMFDFLWLGGAVLRMFVKTSIGFELCHVFNYAGTATDTFTLSPNQPIRYEIRSSTGTGSLRFICAQVSTEGSIDESGKQRGVNTGSTGITLATVGTTYPLLAIRKKTGFRDRFVKQIGGNAFVSSVNDILLMSIQYNPTLSAALTYADVANSSVQKANGDGTITVTGEGAVLYSNVIYQNSTTALNPLDTDFLSTLGTDIDDVSDELVVCGTPITATITAFSNLNYKDY